MAQEILDYLASYCDNIISLVIKYLVDVKPYKLKQLKEFKKNNFITNIDAGMESNIRDIICQSIEYYMDAICWTEKKIYKKRSTHKRKKSLDIEVCDRKSGNPIIRIEVKSGLNPNPSWYTKGAKQYLNTPCIFIGPSEMKDRIMHQVQMVKNLGSEFIIGYIFPTEIDEEEWKRMYHVRE